MRTSTGGRPPLPCDTVTAVRGVAPVTLWTTEGHDERSKNPSRYTGVDRRAPRIEVGPDGLPLPREAYKPGGRHAAITNTLYSWHSYKNWADKVRGEREEKK